MSKWNDTYLKNLFLSNTPLIDVRSPIEFLEGSIPHSINLPIMNTEERSLVGTCYKNDGQEAAIKLGHQLVSGQLKEERIQSWVNYIKAHPQAEVFCFRGGLRSQTSCQWLKEAGIQKTPIEGGYKRMRNFFLKHLETSNFPSIFRLGGLTGSGKTIVLNKLKSFIDLEQLASHRGSAFGENGIQPSQIRFENELSLALMRSQSATVVEDESISIGKISIPKRFFHHMRNSPLIILRCDLDERTQNIFNEYVLEQDEAHLLKSLNRISKSLGGLRFKDLEEKIKKAFTQGKTVQNHEEWINLLLTSYYDPIYERDLSKQKEMILFEGTADEVIEFINSANKKGLSL